MAALWLVVACGGSGAFSVEAAPESAATSVAEPDPVAPSPPPVSNAEAAPTVEPAADQDVELSWTQVNADAPWEARAGLRVVSLDGVLILLGGRTPNQSTIPGDSRIWSDVWASEDRGSSWTQVVESGGDHWAPRAYFQAVTHDGSVHVIGGQDYGLQENPFCELLEQGFEPPPSLGIDPDAPCPEFLPTSQFFNDVWRSRDGVAWEEMAEDTPWEARAGLSAISFGEHIYVFGGSQNDDASIIGAGGPARIYFNDVWRSTDGTEWEQVVAEAPWEPRAGAATVVLGDYLYLLGGEDGFTCEPLPDCEPPYFNDVWRTTDGADWELVTAAAGWSPRPGHGCEVYQDEIVCFGGFGLIENPLDVWASPDGALWEQLPGGPWNATESAQGKYDFAWTSVAEDANGPAAIMTFGGDRETFDFDDPDNWLRIDNDVWTLSE